MRLLRKTRQHRRDFTGVFECEHCGHTHERSGCYDDAYYHEHVIPRLPCPQCGEASPFANAQSSPDVPAGVVL